MADRDIKKNQSTEQEPSKPTTKAGQSDCCAELETCREQLEQVQAKMSYLSADFENFRRNVEKERSLWMQKAQARVFEDLLTIVDDFDRALTDLHNADNLAECEIARFQGFDLINKALWKALASHGIEEISCDDQFDPQVHEALVQVESEEKPSGAIVDVLQKGYTHKGVVIRPAKVSVAK